eukprot:454866-Pleurochrysis_carterae.AAC.1
MWACSQLRTNQPPSTRRRLARNYVPTNHHPHEVGLLATTYQPTTIHKTHAHPSASHSQPLNVRTWASRCTQAPARFRRAATRGYALPPFLSRLL